MSDAGDAPEIDAPAEVEVEVAQEAPKGKMSVEDALQASNLINYLGSFC
jgi:small subunit ribosomal protein S12e